jgi:hypothetical protein
MMKIRNCALALAAAFTLLLAEGAFAFDAHCFCKMSCVDLSGHTTATNVIKDFGTLFTFKGINPQSEENRVRCSSMCTQAAAPYTGSQSIASAACAAGCPNGSVVRAFSAVGNMEYRPAQQIGVLTNQPAVTKTTCTCPQGWMTPDNVVGGVIKGPGRDCKRLACFPIKPGPGTSLPPNGTGTPQWWTWADGLWQTAPVANCVSTTVSQAACHF